MLIIVNLHGPLLITLPTHTVFLITDDALPNDSNFRSTVLGKKVD